MSDNLCYRDAYARETQAVVQAVDPEYGAVLLDRTVFYPGGGGQPADHGPAAGRSRRWTVTGARKQGDEIWHALRGRAAAGRHRVAAELDWDRRHALMRTHSAMHVLCGVIWRDYQALGDRRQHGALSGRMDFEFETMLGELVAEIEARQRRGRRRPRDPRRLLPRDEAFAIPDLIRTKINLLPEGISEVRTIESWAWTSRPTAAPTSRAPARSGRCGSPATSRRAASTSGSGSR